MTNEYYEIDEDGNKKELWENHRIVGANSYDDDWELVSYTGELYQKDKFYAFVDFNADGSEGRIKICPHCAKYGFQHRLGHKIKKKGEKPAPDDDQFLSCYECGRTFPFHETFADSEIKDSLETVQTPFENESIFLSTETRASQRKKRESRDGHRKGMHRYRSKRLEQDNKEDADIQSEIDKGNNVRIIQ